MNKVILIVEDESDLRQTLARTLELEGYDVIEAANGDEAIDKLRQKERQRPNMILMDLMMPGMDGWSLRAELLRDPLLAQIPVVVVSGGSNVPRVAKSMRATAYLEKPFTMETFVKTVQDNWLEDADQAAHDAAVIETMSGVVHRLADLIESLLQQAPIVDDRLMATIEPFDLAALALELVEVHRPLAEKNDVELRVIATEELPLLPGDRELVRLIIDNLIRGAVNLMNGGTVELAVYHDHDAHRLGVRNVGGHPINVSEPLTTSEAQNASEPITSLSERRTAPGVGLGLSLVREILASVNGRLELQTDLEGGNTFVLVLPELTAKQWAKAN
ncbi:MAG: hybrid sensor histidine kinase/response regulator [Bradymonadaceae bacterium]|nr:hybrid sensor histidine kinase/response regulator [Lujinxingiaceae bacterium]